MAKLLTELNDFSYDYDEIKKQKETDPNKPLIVSGVIQRADKLNQNGRIYPKEILLPKLEAYKDLVRERRAVGCLDHDDSAVVDLKHVSHVITDLWTETDGTVYGKVEILDQLPMGKILRGLIEANIKVGISSRALGSVENDGSADIVQDDLHFVCWDFVSEPSTPGAWMIKEAKEYSRDELKKIISKQDRVNIAVDKFLKGYKK